MNCPDSSVRNKAKRFLLTSDTDERRAEEKQSNVGAPDATVVDIADGHGEA